MDGEGVVARLAERQSRSEIHPDVLSLVDRLPQDIATALLEAEAAGRQVMDVVVREGYAPLLRFDAGGAEEIGTTKTTREQFDQICRQLFGGPEQVRARHRAAIERSLHRISVIPTNNGYNGFTLRIERNFPDAYKILGDDLLQRIVERRQSLALLGPNKVGKTTLLRSLASELARRGLIVVVVDQSMELGGEGDVPHPALGSRVVRLAVPKGTRYAEMLIEAVANHSADVVIADEITDTSEAEAIATIVQRKVAVVATVHGDLEKLVENHRLRTLVGGVNDNILISDDVASKRPGAIPGQLNKIQRQQQNPPVFDAMAEIETHHIVNVIYDTNAAVAAYLNGTNYDIQRHERKTNGEIDVCTVRRRQGRAITPSGALPLLTVLSRPVMLYAYRIPSGVVDAALSECKELNVQRAKSPRQADLILAGDSGTISGAPAHARRVQVRPHPTRQAIVDVLLTNVPTLELGPTLAGAA